MSEEKKEEQKPKRKKYFYLKTKSGDYRIKADYLKYEHCGKDKEDIIFFKKELEDQYNDETKSNVWDVAFVNAKDVEFMGIEEYVFRESIPITRKQLIMDLTRTALSVAVSLVILRLFRSK